MSEPATRRSKLKFSLRFLLAWSLLTGLLLHKSFDHWMSYEINTPPIIPPPPIEWSGDVVTERGWPFPVCRVLTTLDLTKPEIPYELPPEYDYLGLSLNIGCCVLAALLACALGQYLYGFLRRKTGLA